MLALNNIERRDIILLSIPILLQRFAHGEHYGILSCLSVAKNEYIVNQSSAMIGEAFMKDSKAWLPRELIFWNDMPSCSYQKCASNGD